MCFIGFRFISLSSINSFSIPDRIFPFRSRNLVLSTFLFKGKSLKNYVKWKYDSIHLMLTNPIIATDKTSQLNFISFSRTILDFLFSSEPVISLQTPSYFHLANEPSKFMAYPLERYTMTGLTSRNRIVITKFIWKIRNVDSSISFVLRNISMFLEIIFPMSWKGFSPFTSNLVIKLSTWKLKLSYHNLTFASA